MIGVIALLYYGTIAGLIVALRRVLRGALSGALILLICLDVFASHYFESDEAIHDRITSQYEERVSRKPGSYAGVAGLTDCERVSVLFYHNEYCLDFVREEDGDYLFNVVYFEPLPLVVRGFISILGFRTPPPSVGHIRIPA